MTDHVPVGREDGPGTRGPERSSAPVAGAPPRMASAGPRVAGSALAAGMEGARGTSHKFLNDLRKRGAKRGT